ncbi:MAG: hypothetical protein ACYDBP_08600 [Leptospirales bacterium]
MENKKKRFGPKNLKVWIVLLTLSLMVLAGVVWGEDSRKPEFLIVLGAALLVVVSSGLLRIRRKDPGSPRLH